MKPSEIIYEAAVRLAVGALRLAAPLNRRIARGVHGRAAALPSLEAWAARHREPDRPLVWLHAPSVGEALMAQAILRELRRLEPGIQSVFTFFSPSAERMAEAVGADWAGYLPWDRRRDVRAALTAIRPRTVAFVRTEIWPALAVAAHAHGARAVMVNAVLGTGSSRTRRPARALLAPAYRRLDMVGAASAEDARRFPLLGVPPERIRVTGDARFDQVWSRVRALDSSRPLLRGLRDAPGHCLVAGSTWKADEERLIPAVARLRSAGVPLRLVIAPHEPTPAHIADLGNRLSAAGLPHERLPSDLDTPPPEDAAVLVVDRVGVLADLYAAAGIAYVGGGFGAAGLHSVAEPAALGVPVLYGPRHGNAREAARLADAGGGFITQSADMLHDVLHRLSTDGDARKRAGAAAGTFVSAHRGGAAANAELILSCLSASGARPA